MVFIVRQRWVDHLLKIISKVSELTVCLGTIDMLGLLVPRHGDERRKYFQQHLGFFCLKFPEIFVEGATITPAPIYESFYFPQSWHSYLIHCILLM